MIRRVFVAGLATVAVAGCAATDSYPIAKTPAMITICKSANQSLAHITQMAQGHCALSGKDAQIFNETNQRCSFGTLTMMGRVSHFKCVAG